MEQRQGPSALMTVILLVLCIVLLGAIFAAIKIFLMKERVVQENGRVDVLFCQTQNCSQRFIAEIAAATKISCAFYELNHPAIIDALAAKNADVIVDDENAEEVIGFAVDATPSKGLMHHKFCVLDGKTVITGSMNPTINDVERNDNNLLIIDSPTLARRYGKEYDILVQRVSESDAKFIGKPARVNISGVYIEQRFCPQEDCEQLLLREIAAAKQEVSFMLFTFTSDPVGDAMIGVAARGGMVRGVVENRQGDTYSEHVRMQEVGLDVRNDANKYTMHHKVIIIDNETVITGSYNPTASANERNDENVLVIKNAAIANEYAREFDRIMALG